MPRGDGEEQRWSRYTLYIYHDISIIQKTKRERTSAHSVTSKAFGSFSGSNLGSAARMGFTEKDPRQFQTS